MTNAAFAAARARLPDAPALVAGVREAVWVSQAGEAETLGLEAVAERLRRGAASSAMLAPSPAACGWPGTASL